MPLPMNSYRPRQVLADEPSEDASLWRYTCKRGADVVAVGYCAQHCPGHATAEDAADHMTQWLLEHRLQFVGDTVERACDVCGTLTTMRADLYGTVYELCDQHRNREQVAALFGRVPDHQATW